MVREKLRATKQGLTAVQTQKEKQKLPCKEDSPAIARASLIALEQILLQNNVSLDDGLSLEQLHDLEISGILKKGSSERVALYFRNSIRRGNVSPNTQLTYSQIQGFLETSELRVENISYRTWANFLSGKAINEMAFKVYCSLLGLNWEHIAEQPELTCRSKRRPVSVGPYLIERELGRGTTGCVYLARHRRSEFVVAVKILWEELASDSSRYDRFSRGSLAMIRMTHPYIVRIIETGTHNGRPYYASEFINGFTLAEAITQNSLSIEERLEILKKIIQAVAECHRRGIVHRDLKPENILVDQLSNPKITDFDCAFLPDLPALTMKTMLGTLRYMSPERLDLPATRDPDDDVYALGVLAIELLSGYRDKPINETLKIACSHANPNKLRTVLTQCIMPRNNGRYKDATILEIKWNNALDATAEPEPSVPVMIRPNLAINYSGQDLSGQVFDEMFLARANFRNAKLEGCSFRRAILSNAVFMNADIRNCRFDGAFMLGTRMHFSKVQGATFRLANLERSVWDSVDLDGTDFSGANFWGAFLKLALNLENSILDRTNFSRNELSVEQEEFLNNLPNINRASNYTDFFDFARKQFKGSLPEELWWSRLVDDPDSMLLYY